MLGGYSTGTIDIGAGATVVVGTGVIWNGTNAREGDTLIVDGHQVIVNEVTDTGHLAIDAWPYTAVVGATYRLAYTSPLRYGANAQLAKDVSALLAVLNATGFFVFVGIDETVPDPSLGEDGQFALQPSTMKRWHKEGGLWVLEGYFGGFGIPAPYDGGTTYSLFDVVTSDGSSYVWINATPASGQAPPNATYWAVLASKGTDGAAATISPGTVTTLNPGASATVANSGTSSAAVFDFGIPAGKGYGGSSATSLAIGTGTKAFDIGAAVIFAYQIGDYVRAKSAANGANFMEGFVTEYNTGTGILTISVIKTGGSGTLGDWNISLSGASGTGDVLSSNNGTEFNAATFASNLSLLRYAAQSLTATQQSQARANIGVQKKNYVLNGAMMVSQENSTTAGTTSGYYPVDQFALSGTMSGTFSVAQIASATPAGSPNRLRVTVTSADASVGSTDNLYLSHKIEGYRVADLLLGSASAKTFILQFGVKAPAGTYSVTFVNASINRSYTSEYTISVGEANTTVVKSVTVSGDITGTWAKDNTTGIEIRFALMAGSSIYAPSNNSWLAANYIGSVNQFNFMGTNGNVFELFDVGLYEGSVAPSFQVPDFDEELRKCQRYFSVIGCPYGTVPADGASTVVVGIGSVVNSTTIDCVVTTPTPMRAASTGIFYRPGSIATAGRWAYFNGTSWVEATVSSVITTDNRFMDVRLNASGLTFGQSFIVEGIAKFNARL